VLYNTLKYNTVRHNTVHYNAVQYSTDSDVKQSTEKYSVSYVV